MTPDQSPLRLKSAGYCVFLIFLLSFFLLQTPCFGSASGPGARAMALGGAFTAVADDGTAFYWNPAGLNRLKIGTFTPSISGTSNIMDTAEVMDNSLSNDELAETFLFSSHNILGLSTKYLGLNIYKDLNGLNETTKRTGKFRATSNQYLALSLAGQFSDNLLWGISLKRYKGETIEFHYQRDHPHDVTAKDRMNGNGLAADLGFLYIRSDRLSFGLMLRNFDSNVRWGKQTTQAEATEQLSKYQARLPKDIIIGIALRPARSFQLTGDYQINGDGEIGHNVLRFGLEKSLLFNSIILRTGIAKEGGTPGVVSGGLGLKLGPTVLDIAVVNSSTNPETFLTIGYKF